MTENDNKKQCDKEKEGYICFDDTPEDFSDYIKYLKETSQKSKSNHNNKTEE